MHGPCLSVSEALHSMQSCVRSGRLPDAIAIGAHATVPLSLSTAEARLGPELASGAESRVYRGTYASRDVAVKQPVIHTSADLGRFREEVKILSSLDHEGVIPLLGARVLPPNYFLVMPLEEGSYYDALYGSGHAPSWSEVIELGQQLCSAMEHVHEHGILHCDIKSRNVLRGRDGQAKIIDFGIARAMIHQQSAPPVSQPSGGFHKQRMLGTLEYMAPEVLSNKGYFRPSDVYAFGVTLNEIASGIFPFSDCTKDNPDAHTVLEMGYGRQELAAAVAAEGLRPTLPQNCPPVFAQIMKTCWALDPLSRPTFSELHTLFKHIAGDCDRYSIKDWTQQRALDVESCASDATLLDAAGWDGQMVALGDGAWLRCASGNAQGTCLSCGAFATAGFRGEDRMEDCHFITAPVLGSSHSALMGVFDGHRGAEASQFAREHFLDVFVDTAKRSASAEDAMISAFLEIEALFESTDGVRIEEPRGTRYPGCTAITALIHDNHLHIGNAGDCRAVLCRGGTARPLSRDHTAMDAEERARIGASGIASIAWQKGSWRIGQAGIQVSRSIGDVDLKPCGVCATPEVTLHRLGDDDTFLILASDGLWDTLSNQEAVEIVHDTVKNPDMCAKRLATEALTRGSQDNITVIVAFLKPMSTVEKVLIDQTHRSVRQTNANPSRLAAMAADEIYETL